MKRFLAFLLGLRTTAGSTEGAVHNDRLRANQPNEPYYDFSFWRALVS